MAETVVVTGGAGFIGSHLVDELVAQGHHVRVIDNLEPQVHGGLREQGSWPAYAHPEAEYVLLDVRDRVALGRALVGADVLFHEAAVVGVGQSMYQVERYMSANTLGTAVLLDVILEEPRIRDRLRKLVVASSMSIYGEGKYACGEHGAVYPRLRPAAQMAAHEWECRCPQCGRSVNPELTDEAKPLEPTSIYAISKKDQEEMCMAVGQAYGIPTVALRYFNTYGSRQALGNPYTGVVALFSSRLLNGRSPVVYEDGCQTRDFVHVSDVVRANLLIMAAEEANFGVFNVGTGRPVAIREVGELLARRLESDRRPQVVEQFRAGDIRHCVADIGRLERLGYRPEVTLEEGMDEVLRWVGSQQAEDRFDEAQRELLARGLAR